MQIIENSCFGLRSAIWTLKNRQGKPTFLLYPMIHIADPKFYSEISARLKNCDVILFEGIRSPKSRRLTKCYLELTKSARLGLVSQSKMDLEHVKERLVHADMEDDCFDEEWAKIPMMQRLLIGLFSPFVGLYLRYLGTRRMLAKHLSIDILETREELLHDDFKSFDELILHKRDMILTKAIDDCIASHSSGTSRIGILYGAAHMCAAIRHLIEAHEYHPEDSEWIEVFEV